MRNTSGLNRGGPGRPKGVPNRATTEARAFCASIVDDPAYQRSLRSRALKGHLAPALEAMLWHYAKGKPKDGDVGLPDGVNDLMQMLTPEHLRVLTDDELRKVVEVIRIAKRVVALAQGP